MSKFYKDFYFGVATDLPDNGKKKPEQPRFAVNDIVYYCGPGENKGNVATVNGYYRDAENCIKVNITITATGEEIDVPQNYIKH